MKPLILMYVYFDKNGDIKAITPSEAESFGRDYNHVMLPLEEVEPFITGKKNSFEFIIKKVVKRSVETFKLTKKFTPVSVTRTLDNYLTKIPTTSRNESAIKIVADNSSKTISISMSDGFKELYEDCPEDERERLDEFLSSGKSFIHITEKNNPYKFFLTIDFLPRELFDTGRIVFDCPREVDLRNSSAYTKRLLDSYIYITKG